MTDAAKNQNADLATLNSDYATRYGFHDPVDYFHKGAKGINHEVVEMISQMKNEPKWMSDIRHEALDIFLAKPTPGWGDTKLLNEIVFENIYYFMKPIEKQGQSWDDVPEYIKKTFDKLGIPEAEKNFLGGVSAQYESEVVYHSMKEELKEQGIIFLDMDSGLREFPHRDPVERQQVRRPQHGRLVGRIIHLRAAGYRCQHPAPGLFPD